MLNFSSYSTENSGHFDYKENHVSGDTFYTAYN